MDQQYVMMEGQQYPITPGQQYPVTPGQQYPITPGQQYPITPVEWPQAIEEFADLKTDSGCPIRAIIIGGTVVLFLCLVIGIILLGIVNSKGTEEDPTEEDTTGGGGDGTSYISEQYIALPNWSRKPSSSQARNRPTSATEKPSTAKTTGHKRNFHFEKEAVICVYGTGFDEWLQFPEEGMCDMTILDSLYKDGRNPFEGPYENDYDHFIRHAREQTKDQFGLSFDFPNYKKLDDLIAANQVPELIQERWSDRISHYAMIDISPYEQSESDVTAAITTMKKLRGLLQAQADKTNDTDAFIALGFSPITNQWNQYISAMLRHVKPDIFVLRGHYTLKNHDQPSCKMAPPNIYKHRDGFKVSMQDAHNALKQVAPACGECAFAVSLSAAGRWNRPVNDFPPFRDCQRLPDDKQQLGSISEVCGEFRHVRELHFQTVYSFRLHERITMLYDNPKTMAFKLCSLKSAMTGVKYGIAVFDLQYEPATPQCGFPKFSRIEMAGNLTTYFKTKFKFESDLTNCLELHDPKGPNFLR